MAQATITSAQDELDDVLDDVAKVKAVLEDAYDPESTREDLAKAIGDALDLLDGYESDDDEGGSDDDLGED